MAVDDATWAAFRELSGSTPASIRLGQLVQADVRRARSSPDASAALGAIRAQIDALEALLITARVERVYGRSYIGDVPTGAHMDPTA